MVVFLIIQHHDVWLWDNTTLVGGVMPLTLLYHAGVSVAAGFTWFLVIHFAWPVDLVSEEASQKSDV